MKTNEYSSNHNTQHIYTISPSKFKGFLATGKGSKLEIKTDAKAAKYAGGDLKDWVNGAQLFGWRVERARIASTYFPGYFITPAEGVLQSLYFEEGFFSKVDAICPNSSNQSNWNSIQSMFFVIPMSVMANVNITNFQFHTTQRAEDIKIITPTTNWCSQISNENLELSQLWIPGTLNSACHVKHHLLPVELKMRNQAFTVLTQLKLGVRYIDLRLRLFEGVLHLHKGVFYLDDTWVGMLKKLVGWLNANPTEFVLVAIRPDINPDPNPAYTWGGLVNAGLEENVPEDRVWTKNFIPTIKEARGRIVLMAAPCHNLHFIPWGGVHQTDSEFYMQDLWDGPSVADKWKAFLHLWARAVTEDAPQQFFLNHLTAYENNPVRGSPNYYSEKLNEFLICSLVQPSLGSGGQIMILDFPSVELIQKIYMKNFE